MHSRWRSISEATPAEASELKPLATLGWAFTKGILDDPSLSAAATAVLDSLGWRGDAAVFLAALPGAIDSKEALVSLAFQHLGLNPRAVCLELLDPTVPGSTPRPLVLASA